MAKPNSSVAEVMATMRRIECNACWGIIVVRVRLLLIITPKDAGTPKTTTVMNTETRTDSIFFVDQGCASHFRLSDSCYYIRSLFLRWIALLCPSLGSPRGRADPHIHPNVANPTSMVAGGSENVGAA